MAIFGFGRNDIVREATEWLSTDEEKQVRQRVDQDLKLSELNLTPEMQARDRVLRLGGNVPDYSQGAQPANAADVRTAAGVPLRA